MNNIFQYLFTAITFSLTGNCTEDVLSLFLQFTTEEEASIVKKELCDMSPMKLYQIIALFIQSMNFRKMVYKVRHGTSATKYSVV